MSYSKEQLLVVRPILSRLINQNPEDQRGTSSILSITLDELSEDIKNNLQQLLNSRSVCFVWPDHYENLAKSIVNYGVEDFGHHGYNNKQKQKAFCRSIELKIESFEPRLSQVRVEFNENNKIHLDRELMIRIDAVINTKPAKATTFESSLDIIKQKFQFS